MRILKESDLIVAKMLKKNKPRRGITRIDSWKTEAWRLVKTDGVTVNEALMTLDWALQNEFWSQHVKTIPKFRERYKNIKEAMKNEK